MNQKLFIYQVFPRLFGNTNCTNKENGSIEENGVGKFSAFSNKALSEIKKMGFTHIWYTGILEHATKTDYTEHGIENNNPCVIKGNAGSPYAIRDYYDVTPDLADKVENRMAEFEELVERSHKAGLKVVIDFVPNHVAREYKSDNKPKKVKDLGANDDQSVGFGANNNFYYIPNQPLELQFPNTATDKEYIEFPAKATGNDRFDNRPTVNDWYETIKLNYGIDYQNNRQNHFDPIPDTWHKMGDILSFWAEKGVDGFRCDMAELVPIEFWNWVITKIKKKHKSLIFIAEVYNPNEYRNYTETGKFDYLYDKVGLYDTLKAIMQGEKSCAEITNCWQSIGDLQPKMLNFLENHDEQRIASDFFIKDPFKAIPAMIVSTTMGNNPIMLYAGQELGEKGMEKEGFSGIDGRTTIFDYWSVASLRNWYNEGKFGNELLSQEQIELREFYVRLFKVSNAEDAITKGHFFDLMYVNFNNPTFDPNKQYTYLRAYQKELLLIISNFDNKSVDLEINIPDHAFDYLEIDGKSFKSHKDLLSGKIQKLKDGLGNKLSVKVEANSGKVFKFSTK